jgi:hypothetical protein
MNNLLFSGFSQNFVFNNHANDVIILINSALWFIKKLYYA